MKRTPLARHTPLRARSPMRRSRPKSTSAQDAAAKRWYQAVAELETCSLCRAYGVQVAHRNEGRGMGQKSPYWLTAALCPPEHHEIDNGNVMTQAERRAAWNAAYVDTIDRLIRNGRLELK